MKIIPKASIFFSPNLRTPVQRHLDGRKFLWRTLRKASDLQSKGFHHVSKYEPDCSHHELWSKHRLGLLGQGNLWARRIYRASV